jgi:hypothetical protein
MKRIRVFALLVAAALGVVVLPLAFNGSDAVAQNNGRCSTQTIKGSYGAQVSGWFGSGAGRLPIAQTGIVVLDGKGAISGSAETMLDGVPQPPAVIAGTYTVDPETCTGTATTTIGTFFFAIVDNGKQTRILGTTPGFTVHGEAVRQ